MASAPDSGGWVAAGVGPVPLWPRGVTVDQKVERDPGGEAADLVSLQVFASPIYTRASSQPSAHLRHPGHGGAQWREQAVYVDIRRC
jgi:hypothetical protein